MSFKITGRCKSLLAGCLLGLPLSAATAEKAPQPLGQSSSQSTAMPDSLRQAWIATRQNEADGRYAFSRDRHSQLLTTAHPQGFKAEARADQLRVVQGKEQVGFHLLAAGCAEQRQTLPSQRSAPRLVKANGQAGLRVEYAVSSALTEWYQNGPLGIEQGFTLTRPLGAQCQESLSLEIAVPGARDVKSHGSHIEITPSGTDSQRLSYSNLFAVDATGRTLPSTMHVSRDHHIILTVATQGARYPIVVDPLISTEQSELAPDETVRAGMKFGGAIAISGDIAVIGAPNANVVVTDPLVMPPTPKTEKQAGAVYVFVRSGDTWTQQAKLVGKEVAQEETGAYKEVKPDGKEDDHFGAAVALFNNTLVVGAPGVDIGAKTEAGAAYVFVPSSDGKSWAQQGPRLVASEYTTAGNQYGASVATNGDIIVIGAPSADIPAKNNAGAAFVLARNVAKTGITWEFKATLLASDGAANTFFGTSVAISGKTIAVGAPLTKIVGVKTGEGQAYVFVYGTDPAVWTEQAKLRSIQLKDGDSFGSSIAVVGDTVLVGADYADVNGVDTGAGYVFVRTGATWSEEAKLTVPNSANQSYIGRATALSANGNRAILGASGAERAYVFQRTGTTWSEPFELKRTDGKINDAFGISVAISNSFALVGADSVNLTTPSEQKYAGVATLFKVGLSNGSACTQNDECSEQLCDTNTRICGLGPNASCQSDADCGSNTCVKNVCLKAQGTACTEKTECGSGFCVDGVCCDSTCGNGSKADCSACSQDLGALTDGTCSVVQSTAQYLCRTGAKAIMCDGVSETCPGTQTSRVSGGCSCQTTGAALPGLEWFAPSALLLLAGLRIARRSRQA